MFNTIQIALVLHITGIMMLAGITLASYVTSLQSWKYINTDKSKAALINSATLVFGRIIGIGGLLTIVSGFIMVSILREGVTSQLWFRIKMLLIILIILNGAIYARRQNMKLTRLLSPDKIHESLKINMIKKNLNISFLFQFILFLVIFILSVFRFS